MSEQLVNTRAAAEILGFGKSTLEHWRITGDGPRFVKIGANVRYRQSELVSFIERATISNTAQTKKLGESLPRGTFGDGRERADSPALNTQK